LVGYGLDIPRMILFRIVTLGIEEGQCGSKERSEKDNGKKLIKIRRGKRIIISLFVGFIPIGMLSAIINETLHINFILLPALYFGLTAFCPQCNQLYYWQMEGIGFRNVFTRECLNCGFDVYKNENSNS
jgi:hypothetical protein